MISAKAAGLGTAAIFTGLALVSAPASAQAHSTPEAAAPSAAAPANAAPSAGDTPAQQSAPGAPATSAAALAPPGASPAPAYDPFERANRASYRFSQGLDHYVIRPVALGYKAVLPQPIRTGVRNVIDNINTPTVAMNDLLQFRPHNFVNSTGRFILNSTVGIGGLFDVAAKIGVAKHQADFGQTLGRWGLQPGPYIYVPVLGPTDLRDGVGRIVDSFANILEIHALHVGPWERVGVAAVDGIDTRASLDSSIEDLNRTATDPYVAIRSIYTQNRQSMITDTATAVDQLPSFDAPPPGAAPASHP